MDKDETPRKQLEQGLLLAITRVAIKPNELGGFHYDVPDDALDDLMATVLADRHHHIALAEKAAQISALNELALNDHYTSGAKSVDYVPLFRIKDKIASIEKSMESKEDK